MQSNRNSKFHKSKQLVHSYLTAKRTRQGQGGRFQEREGSITCYVKQGQVCGESEIQYKEIPIQMPTH